MTRKLRKIKPDIMPNLSDENMKNLLWTNAKWAFKIIGLLWSMTKWVFKIFCLILTLTLSVRGINRYLKDYDMTTIGTKQYSNNKIDMLPAISLCFHQRFEEAAFQRLGLNVTGEDYQKFLVGDHFDKTMLKIKYDDVTTNISDITILEQLEFENKTPVYIIGDARPNIEGWKAPYSSFSWVNWGFFVKCFTLEIPDVKIHTLHWYLDRKVFPNGIRPQFGTFSILFHYPNQILDSINTITRQWSPKTQDQNYWININIRGMNVFRRRYKAHLDNCIQDWKNYDIIMVEKHIAAIGCKAPYQKTMNDWPICDSQEKMKKTLYPIKTGYVPPCRTIEMIDYQQSETDAATLGVTYIPVGGKNWTQWFSITYMFINDKFTVSINKQKMDFESLVGYIGGYVGLFTGFAVTEIPGMLVNGIISMKRLYGHLAHRGKRRSLTISSPGREETTLSTHLV